MVSMCFLVLFSSSISVQEQEMKDSSRAEVLPGSSDEETEGSESRLLGKIVAEMLDQRIHPGFIGKRRKDKTGRLEERRGGVLKDLSWDKLLRAGCSN